MKLIKLLVTWIDGKLLWTYNKKVKRLSKEYCMCESDIREILAFEKDDVKIHA